MNKEKNSLNKENNSALREIKKKISCLKYLFVNKSLECFNGMKLSVLKTT
jgi:hypothetical protein